MSYYSRKLAIGITGVIASTMAISYLIEKIFNEKYKVEGSPNTHYFMYPSLVTWLGCLFCSIYGLFYAAFFEQHQNRITFPERFRLGLLFTLNYLPTNYALLFISYPLQVIAKNTRYLLVVIVGVFFSRVKKSRELKLPKSKIFIAIVISVGAGLFMFYDSNKATKENHFHPEKKWIGFCLLLLAIIFDAFFSDSQAYCKDTFRPSQNQLFLAANLYAFVLIFLFAIATGELGPSLKFMMRHSSALKDVLLIASLQVISQISVYYVISNFKQHIYPLISTVRKLLTILFSIYIFKHKVNFYQWMAIAIVFIAMGYELYDEVMSQEYHRQIRKEKLKRHYIESGEDNKEDTSKEASNYIESSGTSRPNSQLSSSHHLTSSDTDNPRNQSLSKFAYRWRREEIAEHRQTELTPEKGKEA